MNSQIVFDSLPGPNVTMQPITVVAARQAGVVTPNLRRWPSSSYGAKWSLATQNADRNRVRYCFTWLIQQLNDFVTAWPKMIDYCGFFAPNAMVLFSDLSSGRVNLTRVHVCLHPGSQLSTPTRKINVLLHVIVTSTSSNSNPFPSNYTPR